MYVCMYEGDGFVSTLDDSLRFGQMLLNKGKVHQPSPTYLPTYLPTHLPTHPPTYIPTQGS